MIASSVDYCEEWSRPGRRANNLCTWPRDWLCETETNLEAEAYRSALSSAHLAIFQSARAILFRDGVREKSHYCTGLYLQTYVEKSALEEDWPMLFDRIRSVRHADQYSFQAKPTDEEVIAANHLALSFIDRMELLLMETGCKHA